MSEKISKWLYYLNLTSMCEQNIQTVYITVYANSIYEQNM